MQKFTDSLGCYHYIYKVTNNLNGKFYFGIHSTTDLNDGYMGSGTTLRQAQKKYGLENFSKEILEYFRNRQEAENREREIVTEELCLNPNCYNLQRGGMGGTRGAVFMKKDGVCTRILPQLQKSYESQGWVREGQKHSKESIQKAVITRKANMTKERRQQMAERTRRMWQQEGYRNLMRVVRVGKEPGNKEHMMITDGYRDRFVPKDELETLEPGWHIGMSETARSRRYGNDHHKGKIVGEKGRSNLSKSHSNKRWVSNPETFKSTAVTPGEAERLVTEEGWVYGRLNYPKRPAESRQRAERFISDLECQKSFKIYTSEAEDWLAAGKGRFILGKVYWGKDKLLQERQELSKYLQ